MKKNHTKNVIGINLGKLVTKSGDAFMEKTAAAGLSADAVDWKPNRRVLKCIPSDFYLPLQIVTGSDGLRRIVPRLDMFKFIVRAACGGLAVMHRVRSLTTEERKSHALMNLLFQWSYSDRRLMSRTIRRAEDLRLRRSERAERSEQDILPDIEFTGPSGKTKRLTPDELLSRGQRSARELGIVPVTVCRQLNLGLLEMARCSPDFRNALTQDQSVQILRISLFGLDQGDRTNDADVVRLVEERMIEAVQKHLDLSNDEFRRWMWKDFDNIVQQLAKRTNKQGSPVSRRQVRFILMNLLWRSFGYVSQCVWMQMRAVLQALDPVLAAEERKLFDLWYDSQPWTAGLAPILLHHRLDLVMPTLDRLEDCDPGDERPWRDLLQALYWYCEMVEKRRRADCVQKERIHVISGIDSDVAEEVNETNASNGL